MSGQPLSPLPVATPRSVEGVFRAPSKFRTQLPASGADPHQNWFPPLVVIPKVPALTSARQSDVTPFWPRTMAKLPSQTKPSGSIDGRMLPEIILAPEPEIAPPRQESIDEPELSSPVSVEGPFKAAPDFDDNDLAAALAPMMEAVVRKSVYTSEKADIDAFLEPMLRATVRRALAEYSPASRPFEAPGFVDRTVWRIQALFSSRTFEDVLFEKTHRFQVEEVYLLDAETLALVSFASTDPARHSSPKRVDASAKRVALQIRDENGKTRRSFERPDGRIIISETGKYMLLVAIVRGRANELILSDIEFSLRRIEDHFQERFEQAGSALMDALQPYLEDCLLIQAPASAA